MTDHTLLLFPCLSAAALLTAYLCRWRDYTLPARIAGKQPALAEEAPVPTLPDEPKKLCSVVIPVHDQGNFLEENLPAMLEQDFPAGRYEVIVADEASTDHTADVLKRMEEAYPHLRHTFVPPSARFIPRLKLAISLGIRAARSPWVVLTMADCRPIGRKWLRTMAVHFTDGADFVSGYATYINDGSRTARRAIFENLQHLLMAFSAAHNGKAIGANVCNLAVRKEAFIEKRGFADSLTVGVGEGDLLVDALAEKGRTRLELSPEAMVRRQLPSREELAAERLCRRQTMLALGRRGKLYHLRQAAATWALYTLLAAVAARLMLLARHTAGGMAYEPENLYCDVPLLLLFLTGIVLPVCLLRRGTNSLGERKFGPSTVHYEFWQPWRNLVLRFRRWTHRHDFSRKA